MNGRNRTRTCDFHLVTMALYQLSYAPGRLAMHRGTTAQNLGREPKLRETKVNKEDNMLRRVWQPGCSWVTLARWGNTSRKDGWFHGSKRAPVC